MAIALAHPGEQAINHEEHLTQVAQECRKLPEEFIGYVQQRLGMYADMRRFWVDEEEDFLMQKMKEIEGSIIDPGSYMDAILFKAKALLGIPPRTGRGRGR